MNNYTFEYQKLDKTILAPIKANETDSGYDIFAASEPRVIGKTLDNSYRHFEYIDYIEYSTSLVFKPIKDINYLHLFPRSSISKYNLVLANSVGTIDYSYAREVLVRFKYIAQPCDYTVDNGRVFVTIDQNKIYQKGNKIAQLIPFQVSNIGFIEVEKIDESSRDGFGSSGI